MKITQAQYDAMNPVAKVAIQTAMTARFLGHVTLMATSQRYANKVFGLPADYKPTKIK